MRNLLATDHCTRATDHCARATDHWPLATALRILAVSFTLFQAGCRSGLHPVEGNVVWKDGTPAKELAGGHVVFDLPEKQTSARGIIQADGTFHLTTTKPNDGALAGEYKVLILEVGRKPLGGPDSTALAPGAMDSRFSDPSTTDLKATVKPGNNQITLTVDRASRK